MPSMATLTEHYRIAPMTTYRSEKKRKIKNLIQIIQVLTVNISLSVFLYDYLRVF